MILLLVWALLLALLLVRALLLLVWEWLATATRSATGSATATRLLLLLLMASELLLFNSGVPLPVSAPDSYACLSMIPVLIYDVMRKGKRQSFYILNWGSIRAVGGKKVWYLRTYLLDLLRRKTSGSAPRFPYGQSSNKSLGYCWQLSVSDYR